MQPYRIEVEAATSKAAEFISLVEETALKVLQFQGIEEPVSINIILMDDSRIQDLNLRFLGIDNATDVLSFPFGDPVTGLEYHLGDIAISLDRVRVQAAKGGHSSKAELRLLVVHGILHLLGFDHDTSTRKATMWTKQAKILETLNAELHYPVEIQDE